MPPSGSADWKKLAEALGGCPSLDNTASPVIAEEIESSSEEIHPVILTGIVQYTSANGNSKECSLTLAVENMLVPMEVATPHPSLQPGSRLTLTGWLRVIENCTCKGSQGHQHLLVEASQAIPLAIGYETRPPN